jgi:maltooligosyltrehalose synthase
MPTSWTDAISLQAFSEDGIVSIGKALQHFPVALLKS